MAHQPLSSTSPTRAKAGPRSEAILRDLEDRAETLQAATQVRLLDSVGSVQRHVWDGMFPGAAESWDSLRAAESCCPAHFRLGAIVAQRGASVIAAAPVFRTTYELHTSLQGWSRRLLGRLGEQAPGLLRPAVIGLGSPMLDRCQVGFADGLSPADRAVLMGRLLQGLRDVADRERIALLAVKDFTEGDAGLFHEVLAGSGFARIANVPMAYIDLPFDSEAAYLAHLPQKTAGYLKRKLRALSRIRVEHRTEVGDLGPQLHALYESTRGHSKAQYGDFDELHPDYFETLLERCGSKALLVLCWSGDTLVSFQLSLVGAEEIVTKYIGMRYPEARELNLYFINWLLLFGMARERGIGRVRMGNTAYAPKLLLGGRLERSWIYFRHRNPATNWAFHRLAPLIDFERNDPDLARLASAGREPAG